MYSELLFDTVLYNLLRTSLPSLLDIVAATDVNEAVQRATCNHPVNQPTALAV